MHRHPGAGTDETIDRRSEILSQSVAHELGLDDAFIFEDEEHGWKISKYIDGCEDFDYHNPDHVEKAMEMIRRLHGSGVVSNYSFDITDNIEKMIGLLQDAHKATFKDFADLRDMAKRASEVISKDRRPQGAVP